MPDIANRHEIATTATSAATMLRSNAGDTAALRDGASSDPFAPSLLSGCVSELSSQVLATPAPIFTAAVKNYACVYERYQAYLLPSELTLAHDYDLGLRMPTDVDHLGCLQAEWVDSTVPSDDVSDDDIERCGYLGWIHH